MVTGVQTCALPIYPVYIAPFELASRLVTNGEMTDFIADRGYQRSELRLSMGWDWVQSGDQRLPLYWQGDAGNYCHFTLQGLQEVDPNTPVCHLNYFKADALGRGSFAD